VTLGQTTFVVVFKTALYYHYHFCHQSVQIPTGVVLGWGKTNNTFPVFIKPLNYIGWCATVPTVLILQLWRDDTLYCMEQVHALKVERL